MKTKEEVYCLNTLFTETLRKRSNTPYPDCAFDAWKTEAIGFMVKPMTPEGVREQLKKLRYPFLTGGAGA